MQIRRISEDGAWSPHTDRSRNQEVASCGAALFRASDRDQGRETGRRDAKIEIAIADQPVLVEVSLQTVDTLALASGADVWCPIKTNAIRLA